ncbi:MAG: alcohol dehydrogenase catalytic domain-containing protein [Solirubrobacterales bacterium]
MLAATIKDGAVNAADQPDPAVGVGEILVRVRAAGINGADILQRAGGYPAPPGSPKDVPGLEFAGDVAACGDGATRFAVGDRVMAITGGGGQAALAVVHERQAMPVPENLNWAEAGGFPEVFTTAHDAIFSQCGLKMGERLLVHGAAGGVGSAAVQLGANAGAIVTASVRNTALHDSVAALGASRVVTPDEVVDAGPFDVILELVGAPNLSTNFKELATDGRIVVIGVGGGFKGEINLLALMGKRATLRGSTLRARPLEEKALTARAVEREVLPGVESGALHVPVAETFPLSDVHAAYERFKTGGKLGKIVLTID